MNVVVTGAAGGIGCPLVSRLAEAAHQVIATDTSAERLREAAERHQWPTSAVTQAVLDVSSAPSWDVLMTQVAERFAALDALINLAGVLRVESVSELRPESIALQLDVNVKGVMLGTSAAARRMITQRHGRIINVASLAALAPVPGIAVYSASKFAVRAFSLAAAQELEGLGVSVTVICPDAVDTPMVDYQADFPGAALTFSGPRILSADEVARAIVGLLTGRPRLELAIPWQRGLLARISNLFPRALHRRISAKLGQRGLTRQHAVRERRGGG